MKGWLRSENSDKMHKKVIYSENSLEYLITSEITLNYKSERIESLFAMVTSCFLKKQLQNRWSWPNQLHLLSVKSLEKLKFSCFLGKV